MLLEAGASVKFALDTAQRCALLLAMLPPEGEGGGAGRRRGGAAAAGRKPPLTVRATAT